MPDELSEETPARPDRLTGSPAPCPDVTSRSDEMNKYVKTTPWSDPEAAMNKILEIANGVEAVQDGRIHIEKVNGPFLFQHGALPEQYGAGNGVFS